MTTQADRPDTADRATATFLEPGVAARLIGSLTGTGAKVSTYSPGTGEHLATFALSTADDVATAFDRARVAQKRWAQTPPRDRVAPFSRLHDLVLANSDLLDLVQAETGKSRLSAFEETGDVAGVSQYYVRHAPGFLAPRKRAGAIVGATRTVEHHQPKGVVGMIAPWNYPLALSISDAIPALIAGNAVVLKPDTQTALSALRARELLSECGLDHELLQIVVGDPETIGQPMLDACDHIMFTGSSAAGTRIAEAAGRRLIGCTLELGGKNPMLVLADADLDKAARGTARACFSTTGQLCLSTERLFVAAEVYDEFVSKLIARTGELVLGKGPGFGYDVGTLISQRQLDTVVQHVTDATERGARILVGGRARPDLGPFFYEPTILEGVTSDMEVYATETFGPVVSVYKVSDDAEAIRRANDSDYGLNASVWTRDTEKGRRIGAEIHCGLVNINEGYASAHASNDAPMGGMKNSGQGRRHGEVGLLEFTEPQTIASQHFIEFDRPPQMSPERYMAFITLVYRLMKRLHLK